MAAARPRVLFVAPMLPARSRNGLAMRLGVFLEAFAVFADVDLVVIPVAGGPIEPTPFLESFGARLRVHHFPPETDTHFALLARLADPQGRLDAFRHYGKPSLARGLSTSVIGAIAQLASGHRYDLVHVARAYMIPAVAGLEHGMPCTLDLDEDDLASFASRAAAARRDGDPFLAAWLDQEGRACDALLAAELPRFSRIFAASRRDGAGLMRRHPDATIETVPNAIDIPRRRARSDDGRTALFVGAFGYPPNVDALLWFARCAMPRLQARIGRVRLLVAGADPPAAVRSLGRRPNIRVVGALDDLAPLYRATSIAVAPMRSGGGTRIKILEAASFAVPVVADAQSAAPLFGRTRPWGWSASSDADFADICARALRQPRQRERRGAFGYNAVARHHARPAVVAHLARMLRAAAAQA